MPFATINLIVDQQKNITLPGGGVGYFGLGRRMVNFSDIQYVKLNYRIGAASGTTAALRAEWSPDLETTYFPLVPLGPAANSSTVINASGPWVPVTPEAQAGGDIVLRVVVEGTPGTLFTVDFCSLMYR